MVRIGIYCERCLRFVRYGPEAGPCGGLRWIEMCDRCAGALEEARRLQELEDLWALRVCAAPDCAVVFRPATSTQRFHDERCRKRTHRRGAVVL